MTSGTSGMPAGAYTSAVTLDLEPDDLVRRLSIVMWFIAGAAMLTEVYVDRSIELRWTCLLAWGTAFAACGTSFWLTSRDAVAYRGRSPVPFRWPILLAVQAASVVFMISWYRSILGATLLVFAAWQAAQVWPARFALTWAAGQTLIFVVVMTWLGPPLLWVMVALVSGGMQLFAVLVAQMLRAETESRLALARTNQELRLSRELLAQGSRAAERLRVARELHDGMGHQLTALGFMLETASRQPPVEARQSLTRATTVVRDALRELREIVGHMRAEPSIDVPAALNDLVSDIASPRIHLTLAGRPDLDAARAHTIVRCAQEFVTNAIKHAHAANMWITLGRGPEGVDLEVRDDGEGCASLVEGFGLRGIRERVEMLGGHLQVAGGRSAGFAARVSLPPSQGQP